MKLSRTRVHSSTPRKSGAANVVVVDGSAFACGRILGHNRAMLAVALLCASDVALGPGVGVDLALLPGQQRPTQGFVAPALRLAFDVEDREAWWTEAELHTSVVALLLYWPVPMPSVQASLEGGLQWALSPSLSLRVGGGVVGSTTTDVTDVSSPGGPEAGFVATTALRWRLWRGGLDVHLDAPLFVWPDFGVGGVIGVNAFWDL